MDGGTSSGSGLLRSSPPPLPFQQQPTEQDRTQRLQQQHGTSEGSSLVAATMTPSDGSSSSSFNNLGRTRARDVACFISYILSLISIVLVSIWVSDDAMGGGGVSWQPGDAKRVFNWHPVMMVCTFSIMTVSALAFRTPSPPPTVTSMFPRRGRGGGVYDRPRRKILHVIGWVVAACCASVGLVAVFKSHNDPTSGYIANLYSLHSWVGITAVILYISQFIVGLHFFALRISWINPELRSRVMVVHHFVGRVIYAIMAFAVLLGIQEKEGFVGCSYSVNVPDTVPFRHVGDIPGACKVSHALGFVVLITALCTGFVLNDAHDGGRNGSLSVGGAGRGGVDVGVGGEKDGVV